MLSGRRGSTGRTETNSPPNDVGAAQAAATDHLSLMSTEFLAEIEKMSASFKHNNPCPHVTITNFLAPEFCEQLISDFPDCDADVLERFRANNMRGGKSKKQNLRELSDSFLAFDELIKSKEFLEILSKITGIQNLIYDPDYYGGGTHESLHGERLLPHIDYNYHPKTGYYRRLNLLIFLNPEWQQQWGGELELHSDPLDPDNDQVVSCPVSKNNCTILETTSSSWHGFPVIELPADKRHLSRRSIAVYYYTENPPSSDTNLNRSTVYVSEPFPARFKEGIQLSEDDLTNLRELWQMRANLSTELLGEISLHGYDMLYHLKPGDTLSQEQIDRLRLAYQIIEEVSDSLQRIHLIQRNPAQPGQAERASWLRQQVQDS